MLEQRVRRRAPTVAVTQALASETRSAIYERLRESASPMVVRDVAEHFDLHPNVARSHLETLADAGLVWVGRRKPPGGGRPARTYQVDAQEPSPASERTPPRGDHGLLVRMLVALLPPARAPAGPRPVARSAFEVARREGARLVHGAGTGEATTLQAAAQVVVSALRPWAPRLDVDQDGDAAAVTGTRDLVAPLFGTRPDVAQALERGLLTGALEATGVGATLHEADLGEGGRGFVLRPDGGATRDVPAPDTVLDVRDQGQQAGVVAALRTMTGLDAGQVLEVQTEGAGSPATFARWADRAGHTLLAVERVEDERGGVRLVLRKGS